MLQVIVKKGKVLTEKMPAPFVSKGSVLIKVLFSCISAGTEVATVDDSEISLIKKVIERPERILKALDRVRKSGARKFYSDVKNIGSAGSPLGYSLSGVVLALGEGVNEFQVGDFVAAAGAGKANHAEFVDVPKNLVMKCPDGMGMMQASTVTLGGIALQGVRRSDLRVGEIAVVFGAGILGLLAVQLFKLSGIRVIAVDIDERRLEIAKLTGAEVTLNSTKDDIVEKINMITGGYGVDAVLFSANVNSSEPLSQSFQMCRKKGKVVMLGKADLHIRREDVYPNELDFITSTAYGPGRYDKRYEEGGLDYPYAYVRWTENRNMCEYLRLVGNGSIELERLIDHVFPIQQAPEAYEHLKDDSKKPLMVLLEYEPYEKDCFQRYREAATTTSISDRVDTEGDVINVALVGAGSFAKAVHLPNIKSFAGFYCLHAVMSRTGYNAKTVASEYGASYCTTDYERILADPDVNLVFIASNQGIHGDLVLKALNAGKNVFVEKPLAINAEELNQIEGFYSKSGKRNKPLLMVGFNRRFSKYLKEIKKHTEKRINPLFVLYRMNAGYKPLDGNIFSEGGRIVGEACHIIDLMTFLTEASIESISYESMAPANEKYVSGDNKAVVIRYSDGSICSLQYFAVGNNMLEKEYMEVHFDGKSIVLNDYKSIKGYGVDIQEITTKQSDKGHKEELVALYESLCGKSDQWPIALHDMIQTTRTTFLMQ